MLLVPLDTLQARLAAYAVIAILMLGLLGLADPIRFEWAVALLAIVLLGGSLLSLGYALVGAFQAPVFRWTRLLGLLAQGGLLVWAIKQYFFPGLPAVLGHEPDQPLLAAATQRAQESLDRFRELIAARAGTPIAKFPYKTAEGSTEYLWAIVLECDSESMAIRYESAPVTQSQMPGAEKRPISELADWAVILDGGKIAGGFSQRAMLSMWRQEHPYPRWGLRRRMALEASRFVDA
jgi:hypothetical protein